MSPLKAVPEPAEPPWMAVQHGPAERVRTQLGDPRAIS